MFKKLIGDSAIYGLSAILIKSIGFLTLPIYTRIFSPEEFGLVEMFASIAGILSILMTSGLDSAQTYFFMEAKNTGHKSIKEITSSILKLRLLIGLTIVFVGSIFSFIILEFAFNTPPPTYFLWMALGSTFFGTLISQSLEIFRLIYAPWKYVALSSIQTLSGVGFALLFAYYFDWGVEGYLLGILVASSVTMLIGWFATKDYCDWTRVENGLWGAFLKFGLPLLPAGLLVWVMQASDRWFIMKMMGSYEVGLYAVAAKVSLIVLVVVDTFRKACAPIAMDMMFRSDGSEFFKKIALWYVFFGSLFLIVITLLAPFIIKIIAAPEYFSTWKLIGVLSWSSVFYGFYIISARGIIFKKQTHLTILAYGCGAILNIIFNYLLIPIYGMMGAALSTILGLFVANVIAMTISNKFYPIDWPWVRMLILIFTSLYFTFTYVDFI